VAVKKFEFPNSKMADSRHFEKKPLNRHISATVWPILMKFGMATLICPIQGTGSYNYLKMAAAAIFKNHKYRDITAAD